MKKILLAGALASLLISCKKTEVTPTTTIKTDSATVKTSASTQTDDNKDLNDGMDDALNSIKGGFSTAGGRMDATQSCDVSIDFSQYNTSKTITYTYNGSSSCTGLGALKSGKIIVKLVKGSKFEEKGSVYTAEFQAFSTKINGKTINIEGTLTATNTTGGNAWLTILGLFDPEPIVIEKVRGSATASINGSNATTWNFAKTTTVARVDSSWSITVAGDTSINGYTNVIDWGTNRYGESYYKEMTQPFSISSKCGGLLAWYRPSGGKCKITAIRSDNSKYFVNWSWLLNAQGCSNGFELTAQNENSSSIWKVTVNY